MDNLIIPIREDYDNLIPNVIDLSIQVFLSWNYSSVNIN